MKIDSGSAVNIRQAQHFSSLVFILRALRVLIELTSKRQLFSIKLVRVQWERLEWKVERGYVESLGLEGSEV